MEVPVFEAKNRFSALVDRAARGEDIVITKRGRPVAKIVAVSSVSPLDQERARAAMERIRARAKAAKLGPFDWEEVKKDLEFGRP